MRDDRAGPRPTRPAPPSARPREQATGPGIGAGGAPHRGVDRLGAPRGEDHLAGADADQRGHLLAGLLERRPAPCVPRCGPGPGRR